MKKIMIDGIEHELPDHIADAILAARAKTKQVKIGDSIVFLSLEAAAKLEPKLDGMFGEEEEEETDAATSTKPALKVKTEDKTDDAIEKLRGTNDALAAELKAMQAGESGRIDARVSLVGTAKRILGDKTKTDGVSDRAIKTAIVLKVQPEMKDKLAANKSDGYLDGLFEGAVTIHDRSEQTADSNVRDIFTALNVDGQPDPQFDAVGAYRDYIAARTKRPAKKAS